MRIRLFIIISLLLCNKSYAQVVGTSIYLPGNWVEVGVAPNGSWGGNATGGGAGYYPYTGWNNIASVYDWAHNGWTVGPQPRFGDYTYPGTPYEGWALEVNGARSDAFYTTTSGACGAGAGTCFWNQTAAVSALTGANTTYTNTGGTATAVWHGTTTGTSGGLSITQTTQLDQFASWVVTTVEFTNTSAAAIPGVYYWRDFDPDNDETYSGNFETNNTIIYQNPILPTATNTDHKAMVGAAGTSYANATIAIGTKDCRARVLINYQWSPYPNRAVTLAQVYNGTTGTGLTQTWYNVTYPTVTTVAQDIAMGLVYNIGTIPAGGSAVISYAVMYDGNLYPQTCLDSALPEPLLVVNGVNIPPTGPAPDITRDTFNACGSGLTTLPVNIANATTKDWTWSTWTWSPGTGLASTTGVTNTINFASLPPSITYTITGTDSAANMFSCNTRTMYLTILTCNGATVNNPCLGNPLIFNAPGDSTGATYSWYGPAPSTTVVGTTQSFTISPTTWADTGTYHVIKTVGAVHDTASILASINPTPTVGAASNSPLCAGATDTLRLTSTSNITPVTYNWSGPAAFTSTAQNPTIPGFVAADTGIYTVVVTSSFGCTGTASTHVVLLPPPGPPIITDPSPYCQNATFIPFHITATGTVWWYPTAAGTGGTTTIPTVNTAIPGTYTFYFNQIIGSCVSPIDSITVIVHPLDPITGATSLCGRRATITLSDAVAGGTWSSGNPGLATITPATGIVSGVYPADAGGGTVTFTYVNPFGCTSTYPVTINPTPGAPVVSSEVNCQFFYITTPYIAAQFNVTSGTGLTWWGPGVTASYTATPAPTTAVSGLDSYYVTQTNTFGCESDSALVTSLVKPQPAAPFTTDTAYCQYLSGPALLTSMVDSLPGSILSWYDALGNPLPNIPALVDTPSTQIATYPDSLIWYVAQTIDGCESDSNKVDINIIPKPVFTIINQPWVCQFDSITLSYSGSALIQGTYLWTLPAGATVANGTIITGSNIYVQFDSVNQNNYVTLTATDLNGECSTSDTVLIDVIQSPSADAYSKADVCLSDTVTLALSSKSASATDFTWYIDNSPLFSSPAATIIAANSNSGGPYSISWTDTGLHVIYVQAFAEHGCTDKPSADTVYVRPLPDASFRITTTGSTLCLEDSVLFSANDSNYQNNYSWAPIHFFGNNNIDKHDAWGKPDLPQSIITLTITDPFGCIASSSQELNPGACCNVIFPSAFTPNGDTHNDVFRPVPQEPGYHTYHMFRIENRWGQVVYESTDNKAAWDGTFNGVPQDIGVYFYYLKYDCGGKTLETKGDVTLIR